MTLAAGGTGPRAGVPDSLIMVSSGHITTAAAGPLPRARTPIMPELPDVTAYIDALDARVRGARLERVRLGSPFVLRSVEPPLSAAAGRTVIGLSRLGKRIVFRLDGDLFLVVHLMIAGRLHW